MAAAAPRFVVRSSVEDGDEDGVGTMEEGGVRFKEEKLESLVTPPVDLGGRRIRYCVLEVRLFPCFHLFPPFPPSSCAAWRSHLAMPSFKRTR